ncbi:unnamed protein product [Lasius platythorax]|uniref:Uncharacterized protein n=1 Tax=Lasius platythorax TaxID=488582 RepID=A0AAV2NCZ7_9HYME
MLVSFVSSGVIARLKNRPDEDKCQAMVIMRRASSTPEYLWYVYLGRIHYCEPYFISVAPPPARESSISSQGVDVLVHVNFTSVPPMFLGLLTSIGRRRSLDVGVLYTDLISIEI